MARELQVMGVYEACRTLDVSGVTLWRWIQSGKLVPDASLACGPIFRTSTIGRIRERRNAAA